MKRNGREDHTVGSYLVKRLEQLGLKHIFGVPGDYCLEFFDLLEASSLTVVGTCNELNAGYAADGYSRMVSLGAVCVTYGVGGLSLANAVGGAMAERIPLIVISGAPPVGKRSPAFSLHHTFDDPAAVRRAYEPLTLAALSLEDAATAPRDIDAALRRCVEERGPIYIELPLDMVDRPCAAPSDWSPPRVPPTDEEALTDAVARALEVLTAAENPIVWSGSEIRDFGLAAALVRFVEYSGWAVFSSRQSRGVFPETHPRFAGLYHGRVTAPDAKARFDAAGALLSLGVWWNNINTSGFSIDRDPASVVRASRNRVVIGREVFAPVGLGPFVERLAEALPAASAADEVASVRAVAGSPEHPGGSAQLTSDGFFHRLGGFLHPGHVLILDIGGPMIGGSQIPLAAGVDCVVQGFYLSLGHSVPASLGVGLAAADKRPVVVVGDGAFQMTGQELSTMVRRGLAPVVFVLNNDGYQVERAIHDGPYNDLHAWHYHRLPGVFGGGWGRRVTTAAELEDALARAGTEPDTLALIEVMIDRWDFPQTMAAMFDRTRT